MTDETPEGGRTYARPIDPVGRALLVVSRLFALLGGFVLCAMGLMTTISVLGRKAIDTPVPGDFELMAVGTGVAVFLILPYTQMMGENVIVDFFLEKAPEKAKRGFDALGSLLYGVLMAIITWRTALGGIDVYENGQATTIIQFRLWWTFPLAVLCLILLVAVCAYTFRRSVVQARAG